MTRPYPSRAAFLASVYLLPLAFLPAGCGSFRMGGPARESLPGPAAEREMAAVVARHGIVTAGAGVLRGGKLVWEGYFCEMSPGVPATATTRFNVASITKTVAAETILRLAAQGRLSLDEPMAAHWADPDLVGDPRQDLLTPSLALSHRTGFPNWRFFLPGGKLALLHPPGERYGYSGEGFEYLARFAEKKLGQPFPDLVEAEVLKKLGMAHTRLVVRRDETAAIARPVDAEGRFHGWYCRPEGKDWCRAEGSWSAADDMVTTVRDYAAFLGSVAAAEGYGRQLAADRDRVQADKGKDAVVDCAASPAVPCPDSQGYGLGFNVLRYGDDLVLGHDGADWSELAVAYVSRPSGAGVLIFLNAPNRRALAAMPELLEIADPGSPFLSQYRRWLAAAEAREAARP